MSKFIFTMLAIAILTLKSYASPTVETIANKIKVRLQAMDEEFSLTMRIIESDKSEKIREFIVFRMSPSVTEHFLLMRILKPIDVKNMALLVKIGKSKEERWIYLPSSKQIRRLSGDTSKGSILGSELYAEDFDVDFSQRTKSRLLNAKGDLEKNYYVLESNTEQSSKNYIRVVSYINKNTFLPEKVDCYNKKNHLFKVLEFKDYIEVQPGKWRPQKISISNIQTKRKTEILFARIKLNQNFKSSFFTPNSLNEE